MKSFFSIRKFPVSLCLFGQLIAGVAGRAEFLQTDKIVPHAPSGDDRFGVSTALSGDTLVVSAPEYRAPGQFGAAHVYTRSAAGWELSTTLLSPYNRPFAMSVATDGDTIIIGGTEDRAVFGGVDAGLAFVYTRAEGTWVLSAELSTPDVHSPNREASSVAVEGDTIVVASSSDRTFGVMSGAAYIFQKAGGSWNFHQKLYPPDLNSNSGFGSAADLHGDSLAIAANLASSGSGAVHLFERENGIWTHRERVVAPDMLSGHIFGRSVALSDDLLLAGRTDDDDAGRGAGAVYVFALLPDSVVFVQKLFAADAAPFSAFGTSVAFAGEKIVAGAPSSPWEGAPTVGSAYVFELMEAGFEETEKLVAQDPTGFSGFGWSLAASPGVVAVGAIFHERNGAVYVFEEEPVDTEPPVLVSASANPPSIFPPNRKMVPVTIQVEATDNVGITSCRIVSVRVDEPSSVKRTPAFEITGALTVDLRAERNARGRRRTYSILLECADAAGNVARTTLQVQVL